VVLAQSGSNILDFVDPLIGTINGGHVFAGATLPFGMAKAVADVDGDDYQGGFAFDGGTSTTLSFGGPANITGFSHMHDSGTGGVSVSSLIRRPTLQMMMKKSQLSDTSVTKMGRITWFA
jgi:putative alpha-1,2-mannosidase